VSDMSSASDAGRAIDRASDQSSLTILPFSCLGICIAEEVRIPEFWQGYRIMSGILLVFLAMEVLILGVLQI
jgi:hypothetical protein